MRSNPPSGHGVDWLKMELYTAMRVSQLVPQVETVRSPQPGAMNEYQTSASMVS